MKSMFSFFRHFVYLNGIVSLSTGILSAGFAYFIGIRDIYLFYGVFAFLATFTVYNGQRLFKVVDAKTNWMLWVRDNSKLIEILTVISAVLAVLCFVLIFPFYNSFAPVYVLIGSAVVSIFYVVKIKGKNLRDIPYLKIHLIGITWVVVLIIVPALRREIIDYERFFILCFAHYCYVLAVTIPFDIRDLKYDAASQKTLPQVLGIQAAKNLALLLLGTFAFAMLYLVAPLAYNGVFYVAVGVQALLILGIRPDRSDLYCAGGIDGAIALLGLAYFLN